VRISADPLKPSYSSSSWSITPPASHLVLFVGDGKDGSVAIQPDTTVLEATTWSNAAGGSFEGVGIEAWFDLSKIPAGEFTVAVITNEREYRTKVNKAERLKLQ
jgi:hypothetical protein